MSNTSTGGFLLPAPQPPPLASVPANLTFIQFIQTVLVGISGFPGTLVRPSWQVAPPKQPDIGTDWIAFGLGSAQPDFNAFVGYDSDNNPILIRNELIPIQIQVYGPHAYDNIGLLRDGFQLTQNLASLKAANVGFAYDTTATHSPDLINERWTDRWVTEFYIRRQIQRTYPILNFISMAGIIYTQTAVNDDFELPFSSVNAG